MTDFYHSQIIYTVIDNGLNKKYITDEYKDVFNKLKRGKQLFNPYNNKADISLNRTVEMLKYHRRARREILEGR